MASTRTPTQPPSAGAYEGRPPSEASGTRRPPVIADPIAALALEVRAMRREHQETLGQLLREIAQVREEATAGIEAVMGEVVVERDRREGQRDSGKESTLSVELERTRTDLAKTTKALQRETATGRMLRRATTGAAGIAVALFAAFVNRACNSRELAEAAEQVAVAAAEDIAGPVAVATAQATATAAQAQVMAAEPARSDDSARIDALEAKLDAILAAVQTKPRKPPR